MSRASALTAAPSAHNFYVHSGLQLVACAKGPDVPALRIFQREEIGMDEVFSEMLKKASGGDAVLQQQGAATLAAGLPKGEITLKLIEQVLDDASLDNTTYTAIPAM
jgi:hypothetical protein